MEQTLGVHYQTWKNRPAVNYVLENFRKYYPNAPVRMVSDNGEDFSDLAQKYNCVFDFENINIFPKGILAGHPMSGITDIELLGAYVWLRRLYDTCKLLDTDWIVIMEDDVLTRGVVSSFPSTHAGGVVSFPLNSLLTAFLMGRNLNNKIWGYGLCGGGIINRSFFVNAYEKYIQEFDLKFISNFDSRVYGWSDILLTVFIIYAGGTYSVWNDVEDKKHNFRPDAAFEHDVKQFYTETSQGSLNK